MFFTGTLQTTFAQSDPFPSSRGNGGTTPYNNFGVTPSNNFGTTPYDGGGINLADGFPFAISNVFDLLYRLIDALQIIAAPIAVIMIVYAAFLYTTSAGRSQQITQANRTITWAVVGLGVLFLAEAIVSIIQGLFT